MSLKIALEWFLNPDHLPLMFGIQNIYKKYDLVVELIEPKEHYDGFELLKNGDIDIVINEPLHLFEHYFDTIKSIGTFFETNGGVLLTKEGLEKLKNNQLIRITTPASNDVTNKIGFEILNRYAKQLGIENISIQFCQTDFYHIKNIKEKKFDGAWLCFYNFEGIEANMEGLEYIFIDQHNAPYPNFSALDLITTQNVIDNKKEQLLKFLIATQEAIKCLNDFQIAKECYYSYTNTSPSYLMDNIINDTIDRFKSSIVATPDKYKDLYLFLESLDIVKLSEIEYQNIWVKV